MVSTYTSNINLEKPAQGDQVDAWGTTVNSNSDIIDTQVANKLPLAGGQMSVNITMAGTETVDGRDLRVDGSKLDGIATGATAVGGANTVHFNDNVKATFGDSSSPDLEIYHDGNDSYIHDGGTGDLIIRGETNIRLTNKGIVDVNSMKIIPLFEN